MQGEIKRGHKFSLFVLGITSIVLQVLLIREILAYTGGNELVIGICFSFWMLFTGLGSLAGKLAKKDDRTVPVMQVLLVAAAILSYIAIPLIRIRSGMFISMAGLGEVVLLTLFSLAVPCLILGMLFPVISGALFDSMPKRYAAVSYGIEALGSVTGGILFIIILLLFLDNRAAWIFLVIINIPPLIISSRVFHNILTRIILIIIPAFLLFGLLFFDPGAFFTEKIAAGKESIIIKDTPFGRIAASNEKGQINLYENSLPVFSTGNVVTAEEPVHLGMSFLEEPSRVLLISGGNPETIEELLKYSKVRIDFVTSDPWMYSILEQVTNFPESERLNFHYADPAIFLKKTAHQYDLILSLTPAPSTAAANRYFTSDFFSLCKMRLNDPGILLTSLPFEGNYLNEESRQLHSIVHSSLKSVFTEVRIIAMGRNFFISGEKVPIDLLRHSTLLEQKNLYYNKNYISEELVLLRSREIERQLEDEARINSNLAPYGYYAYLGNWVSMFNIELSLLLYPLLFVLVIILVALKPVQLGVFTGGFTVSALQFLIMIAFQSLYGYIYLLVALFIAVFMGGLGLGSFYFHRIVKAPEIKHLARNQALIGLSALILPLIALLLSGSNELPAVVIYILFSLFVAVTGLLMGVHFGISSELSTGKVGVITSGNYAADLAGSALGAFIVSLFIFPLTGIYYSCLVLAGLNFVVLPVVFKRGKNL